MLILDELILKSLKNIQVATLKVYTVETEKKM